MVTSRSSVQVDVDTTFFSERDRVALRYDLAYTGVFLCAPEVLVLFSDNFDYQHVTRDFVRGVLSEEELGNKIFVHEVGHEYVARCATLRAYAAISLDLLGRWAPPLFPDSNLLPAAAAAAAEGGGEGDWEGGSSESDYSFSARCMCALLRCCSRARPAAVWCVTCVL